MRAWVVGVLVALAGCAFVTRGKVDKLSRQVAAYEKLEPDAEALGRGDVEATSEAVRQMADWAGHIEQQQLPPVERQRLVDRLAEARRRYLLAAAKLANTPDLGYALARIVLVDRLPDDEALAIVRALSDARARRRQELHATAHTYALAAGPQWTTTSRGMAVVDGRVVAAHARTELAEPVGNCVFATRPFGDDATPNPGLTFRLVGRTAFYVRCYFPRDPRGLPRADASWVIQVSDGGFAVKQLAAPPAARYRDFLVTPTREPGKRLAHLQLDLTYDHSDGFVVVWEQGIQRLRKRMRTIKLAGSPVFWERG